jgi:cytochrome P450
MSTWMETILPPQTVLMDLSIWPLAFLTLLLSLLGIIAIHARAMKGPRLPPGPRQLPVIGNLHQMPPRNVWIKYQQWHQKYGPIITLKNGQRLTISLGSHKVARDLLQKRSSNYSSRPPFVKDDSKSKGLIMGLMPYGDQWKRHRRFVVSLLNANMAQLYQYPQDIESKQLLCDMLEAGPESFSCLFRRYTASLVLTLACGERIPSVDDKRVEELDATTLDLADSASGINSMLLQVFPILNYLPRPLAPWRRKAKEVHNVTLAILQEIFARGQRTNTWNWSKEAMKLLNDGDDGGDRDKAMSLPELVYAVGLLYQASTTTNKAADCFVMACALHPVAVGRAQEELDAVVGSDRLPSFDDVAHLPYINAFVNEVLRWRPIAPMGLPHANLADDNYMGYDIPVGTTVLVNHWALALDQDVFSDPDPLDFRPERWLSNPNPPVTAFGFGKRQCPGQHIGRRSMFIIIARVLWGFNISHAYDEKGCRQEIDPWMMEQAILTGPLPFQASIRVRSPRHREVIEQAWAGAEKDPDKILDFIQSQAGFSNNGQEKEDID